MIVRYTHRLLFLPNLFLGLPVIHELFPDSPLERSECPQNFLPGVRFPSDPINDNFRQPLHSNDRKILPPLTFPA